MAVVGTTRTSTAALSRGSSWASSLAWRCSSQWLPGLYTAGLKSIGGREHVTQSRCPIIIVEEQMLLCFISLGQWLSPQVRRHLIRYFPLTIWLLINSFRLLIVLKFQRRLNIPHPLIRTPRPLTQQRTQHNEALFTALGATITWSDVQTPATDRPLCPRRLTSVRLNIRVYKMYVYIQCTCIQMYLYIKYTCTYNISVLKYTCIWDFVI